MSMRYPAGIVTASYFPLKVPNAPTIGTATSSSPTSVSVTFTAPSNVGGGAITSYVATARKTSDGTTVSGTGSSSPVTISGLTTNSAYTVTVAAVNAFGAGPSSAASNSVTPLEQQLWAWGVNSYGQLGLGNTTQYSSPKQVGALIDWAANTVTSAGGHTLAVKTNGTLWSWGRNGVGQLGSGTTGPASYRSSPVQVGALSTWLRVSAGYEHSLAIRTDGTLWSWGGNNKGQLGLGNTTSYSSPKQVGALTNWADVSGSPSSGQPFSLALKTNGTIWSWGDNQTYGQLGLGNLTDYSSPKQIGALTTWASISAGNSFVMATTTSGALYAWGRNDFGQVGLGNTTYYSSPKQVGALTNWLRVTAGRYHTLAVKTDGTLWAWGQGAGGKLGLNNSTNYSSPKQVGALTNWSRTSISPNASIAVKTDGTLWSWGSGTNGQLGLGNTNPYSSPKQVGSLTTWQAVSMGTFSVVAIKG